ncbi:MULTISPECIES: Crp/Fnr family transcriptional regulator [Methylobacterium]|jgi:CRP-like cAMP-binding protein|uniref:Crp/Fnr family transcriptional regulator n=2 Tax=Methylobacterium TaxID=407 RepID=A0A2R4WM09_9HYPH|nr:MULTISPECIES: Crp/Fnr family transcriptional regulator [Methylobacterium]MBZ6411091.1 Crp/Fnr family transcriptional regulator [Methylobacterium sp.]AWB22568.1 Crp/Fnr family transcriptional regulator [Methylobacterium currus]MBK3397118.1 Crp/Fnr family transcriptional regulator [Methylobacterium ajmalii]MBK3408333.1 Crp/Fnr family transcriptional regulator [Methylobacterium ajmalii]MBK3421149.1 Crp/Fnr family transcriptional regulator [Methylobacterium ajmalii]
MPSALETPLSGNLLLRALRVPDRALLEPHLELKPYRRGEVLFEAGVDVSHISFPLGPCVAALVIGLQDGRAVETATVGHEGAIGGVVSQGLLPAFSRAVVQVPGSVLRVEAAVLQQIKQTSPGLRNLMTRYSDCLLAQVLQSVACNASHTIEARCSRWLLSLQDRLGSEVLPITHEVLAELLGVQRSYLTRTLRTLQEQGLIQVRRGRIIIESRPLMEAAACECHGAVKRHFETVLGAVYNASGTLVSLRPVPAEGPPMSQAV